jgi:diadenosine tetraphosphate (Ap4A) HIT family hydrolase
VPGFGHLEPVRHIASITDLDGEEAITVGAVLARVTTVLKQATGADLVYVYVFGERVAHLHFNLAPHRPGDALVGGPGLLRSGAEPLDARHLVQTNSAIETALSK